MDGFRRSRGALGAAAILLIFSLSGPAAAQVADACSALDSVLVAKGKSLAPAPTADQKPATASDDDAARQLALNQLADAPPSIVADAGGLALAGPGVVTVAFEDKRIEPLADTSRLCVKAFAGASGKWERAPIRQLYLSDKSDDRVKRLFATFEVQTPASATLISPTADAPYLLVVALPDVKDPLSYKTTLRVTSHWYSTVLTLIFVSVFYAFIAWATYDKKDVGALSGLSWIVYTLSPIRISAAWYGEASMSQVQVLLFTFIVAGLLFHLFLTTQALSDISTDLLKLLGISAIGAAGAKFTQTLKTSLKDETASYLIGKGWYNWRPIPGRNHATIGYLLLTDGRLDVYKFQIAIFTLVVAWYVLSSGQASLGDVKISETMLYLIGISQGVYVGGKAVTDRTTDLEAAVSKMRDLEAEIAKLTPATMLAAGAPSPDLAAKLMEFEKAATVAVAEFAPLYKRRFPTKAANDPQDVQYVDPAVLKP